jgi:hypothetical protein
MENLRYQWLFIEWRLLIVDGMSNRGRLKGNVQMNVVPLFGVLVTSISPSRPVINSLTICKPSPAPKYLFWLAG